MPLGILRIFYLKLSRGSLIHISVFFYQFVIGNIIENSTYIFIYVYIGFLVLLHLYLWEFLLFVSFLYFLYIGTLVVCIDLLGDIRPLWTVRYGQQRMNSPYPVISLQTQTTKYLLFNIKHFTFPNFKKCIWKFRHVHITI